MCYSSNMSISPKEVLKSAKCVAFLITNPVHLRYITGFDVEYGMLLVSKSGFQLYTSLAFLNDTAAIERAGISVFDTSGFLKRMKRVQVCGFESDHVTMERYSRWKKQFPKIKFVPITGIIEQFRRRKNTQELKHIQQAWMITKATLAHVPNLLKIGMTEKQLAHLLFNDIIKLGADGLAFDSIVAFGSNTSHPHHRPSDRKLKQNDSIQIDIGAKLNGYCSDGSDVFFVGNVPAKWKDLKHVLDDALQSAKKQAKIGTSTRALDEVARSILRKAKVEDAFCHALGHGLGLEIHEGVTLSQKAPDQKLLNNEVLAIEPGIYFPGKFGMRVEETIFVV